MKNENEKMQVTDVKSKIKVGQLLYTSWGYDQTNYDYIMVVKLSPSGKTAICKRASHSDEGFSGQCNIQKPIAQPFGEEFRLKVVMNYDKDYGLRGSYPFLHTGEGSKRMGGFSKIEENKVFYETDSRFGH
jgi:hypothetical protein